MLKTQDLVSNTISPFSIFFSGSLTWIMKMSALKMEADGTGLLELMKGLCVWIYIDVGVHISQNPPKTFPYFANMLIL